MEILLYLTSFIGGIIVGYELRITLERILNGQAVRHKK